MFTPLYSKRSFDDAYRKDQVPFKGCLSDAITSVKRSISSLTRNCNSVWIEITSDGENGLQDHWNSKYKRLGMKTIAWVYITTSEKSCKAAKKQLVAHYDLKSKGTGILDNERSCGGPLGS